MGEIAYVKMRGRWRNTSFAPTRDVLLCSASALYYFWFSVPHPSDEGFLNEYGRNRTFTTSYEICRPAGTLRGTAVC